jgi:hypothetical protein
MTWFIKYYRHERCGTAWIDEWCRACDDECPKCGAEIEPYRWDDLSVRVDESPKGWLVSVSPPTAEHSPEYEETFFDQKGEACAFAASEAERIAGQLEHDSLRRNHSRSWRGSWRIRRD